MSSDNRYQVVVGNLGMVYDGEDWVTARDHFDSYKRISQEGRGRAGGESVVLFDNGEVIAEHEGVQHE